MINSGRVDGREVSETERQFLACWKATRKARRKAQRLNKGSQGILEMSSGFNGMCEYNSLILKQRWSVWP